MVLCLHGFSSMAGNLLFENYREFENKIASGMTSAVEYVLMMSPHLEPFRETRGSQQSGDFCEGRLFGGGVGVDA